MLSRILSWIFLFCFFVMLLFGVIRVGSTILKKDFKVTISGGEWTLSQRGMFVKGNHVTSTGEHPGDTIVTYKYLDSLGNKRGGGDLNLSLLPDEHISNVLASYKQWDTVGFTRSIDTSIIYMGEVKWGPSQEMEELEMPFDQRLMFPAKHTVIDGFSSTQLRILPQRTWEHVGHIVVDIICTGSVVLFLFFLSQLFRNFGRREYFSDENPVLLRRIGWLMLIPQITQLIVWWVYLKNIHPIKLKLKKDFPEHIMQYDIVSDFQMNYIFFGAAVLILSYIFRDALRMKKENALTI